MRHYRGLNGGEARGGLGDILRLLSGAKAITGHTRSGRPRPGLTPSAWVGTACWDHWCRPVISLILREKPDCHLSCLHVCPTTVQPPRLFFLLCQGRPWTRASQVVQ